VSLLISVVISFLVGIALGHRFPMLILVPAIGLASAFVAANGVLIEEGIWRIVGSMVTVVIFVQLGYLGGNALRSVIRGARAADHARTSITTSTEVPSSEFRGGGASARFEASKQLRQA
jgi:mannitol-specific phosphotransferase system IIBC component